MRGSGELKQKQQQQLLEERRDAGVHGRGGGAHQGTGCCRCSSAPTCPRRTPPRSAASGWCRCESASGHRGRNARCTPTSPSTTTSHRSLQEGGGWGAGGETEGRRNEKRPRRQNTEVPPSKAPPSVSLLLTCFPLMRRSCRLDDQQLAPNGHVLCILFSHLSET